MHSRTTLILTVLALAGAGCAGTRYLGSGIPLSARGVDPGTEFGPRPDADACTLQWVRSCARDPEGARVGPSSEPSPGYVVGPFWARRGAPGWVWTATLNLRNGFGGRAGPRVYYFHRAPSGLTSGWPYREWLDPPVEAFAGYSSRAGRILSGGGELSR
jgi:hypothetical protein